MKIKLLNFIDYIYFTSILIFILMSACNIIPQSDEVNPTFDPPDLTQIERKAVSSDNRFGFKLFRNISETQKDSNIFLSPLSVSMALGMALNGAAGSTYDAMVSTLERVDLSETEINESYRNHINLLIQLDPKVYFRIANSIWYRLELSVEQSFLNINQTYFDAEIASLDFNSLEAVDVINNWVSDKTNSKIENIIIPPIDPNIIMYLINAVYFKGTWMFEFDENNTQDDIYYNFDGTTSIVPIMILEATLPFLDTDTFIAVDIPYGDSLFSMSVFLPHVGEDINALVEKINDEQWDEWMNQFTPKNLQLFFPRFKLEYQLSLVNTLKTLGMSIAFHNGADFTRIDPQGGLFISDVRHKTFIEVNEEGTEAAAVTAVEFIRTTSIRNEPFVFRVDHPFIFVIHERITRTILFIGKVLELEAL